jgi:hypothetical protein
VAGPRLIVDSDQDYDARLRRENIQTWYGTLCKAAQPRAFARLDSESGPTLGDTVFTTLTTYRRAARALRSLDHGGRPKRQDLDALRSLDHGGRPKRQDLDALRLLVHEHAHCMVRLWNGHPDTQDLERLSHPDKALPAIRHAFRTRFGLNAFTGLLRWRNKPKDAWMQGLQWFRGQVALLRAEGFP